jgi:hypothetical protein
VRRYTRRVARFSFRAMNKRLQHARAVDTCLSGVVVIVFESHSMPFWAVPHSSSLLQGTGRRLNFCSLMPLPPIFPRLTAYQLTLGIRLHLPHSNRRRSVGLSRDKEIWSTTSLFSSARLRRIMRLFMRKGIPLMFVPPKFHHLLASMLASDLVIDAFGFSA